MLARLDRGGLGPHGQVRSKEQERRGQQRSPTITPGGPKQNIEVGHSRLTKSLLLLSQIKDISNMEKTLPGCGWFMGCLSLPLWLAAAGVIAFLAWVFNYTHSTPPPRSSYSAPTPMQSTSQSPSIPSATFNPVGEWLENDGKRRFIFHSENAANGQIVEVYTRHGRGWNAWQTSVSNCESADLNGLSWDGKNYWTQCGNDIHTCFAATHMDLPPSYYSVGYTFTIASNDKLVCRSIDKYISKHDETGTNTTGVLLRQEDPPGRMYLTRTGR